MLPGNMICATVAFCDSVIKDNFSWVTLTETGTQYPPLVLQSPSVLNESN